MSKIGSILIILMLWLAGCSSWTKTTEQSIQRRYHAAKSIKYNAKRDDTLCSLALEAAKTGKTVQAKMIARSIGRNNLRDRTLAKIARQ